MRRRAVPGVSGGQRWGQSCLSRESPVGRKPRREGTQGRGDCSGTHVAPARPGAQKLLLGGKGPRSQARGRLGKCSPSGPEQGAAGCRWHWGPGVFKEYRAGERYGRTNQGRICKSMGQVSGGVPDIKANWRRNLHLDGQRAGPLALPRCYGQVFAASSQPACDLIVPWARMGDKKELRLTFVSMRREIIA